MTIWAAIIVGVAFIIGMLVLGACIGVAVNDHNKAKAELLEAGFDMLDDYTDELLQKSIEMTKGILGSD